MADPEPRKRKDFDNETEVTKDNEDDSEDSDTSMEDKIVNVDFDYFDPREIDFQAVKNLLRQLLDTDNTLFDLSGLADLIVQQKTLGSTIKTDGIDSDPLALLTVLNIKDLENNEVIKTLKEYFISKTSHDPQFNRQLRRLFTSSSTESIGLIISERLINMPTEVVPPMYKMLADEIQKAVENLIKKMPYSFDYLLVVSKKFTEEESEIDKEDNPKSKKNRFDVKNPKESYFFHPEDELLQKKSSFHTTYSYTNESQNSDSKRAFQEYGIFPQGNLILFKTEHLNDIIADMESTYPPF